MEERLCILCNKIRSEDRFTPVAYSERKFNYLRDHVCDVCKHNSKTENKIDFSKENERSPIKRFDYLEMNEAKYNILFAVQEGRCKICNKHQSEFKRKLAVDHDHKTNEVRGLLCNKCNTGIGLLKEDLEILKSAISYIKDSKRPLTNPELRAIRLQELKIF